jgi:hypothetical protein
MTNDERKKIIIRAGIGTIVTLLFAVSIVSACDGEFVQAGILFIALSVVNVFYYGFPFTIFWGLCGIGILLLGYEKRAFAMAPLGLAVVILAADIILWIRAIKRDGMRGLLRVKITDRHNIYARRYFYEENEITCILWDKLRKNRIRDGARINGAGDVLKTVRPLTNDERKKFKRFFLSGSIMIILLISAMVCISYDKFVWAGVLFIAMGIVNTYFLGLSFTITFILIGLMLVSDGYEKSGLATIFVAFALAILIANGILMYKSIAGGALERLEILGKSNRFALFDYLKENDITWILLNKLKHRLN